MSGSYKDFEARNKELQTLAREGKIARYQVRVGIELSGKITVWDALGGWACSSHKSLNLAEQRARELNKKVSTE